MVPIRDGYKVVKYNKTIISLNLCGCEGEGKHDFMVTVDKKLLR